MGNKYFDSQYKMILRPTHLLNVFNILITLLNMVAVRQASASVAIVVSKLKTIKFFLACGHHHDSVFTTQDMHAILVMQRKTLLTCQCFKNVKSF